MTKKKKNEPLILRPQEGPQSKFLQCRDDIFFVLFGGGAKSHWFPVQ